MAKNNRKKNSRRKNKNKNTSSAAANNTNTTDPNNSLSNLESSTKASVEANGNVVEVKTDEIAAAVDSTPNTNGDVATVTEETQSQDTTPSKQSLTRSVLNTVGSIITSPFSPKRVSLPPALESSIGLFTPAQQELARKLCALPGSTNQSHLFENWSDDPSHGVNKMAFMSKLELVDTAYPDGGLIGYLNNAVDLLEKSRRGENPLEGWTPSVPQGEAFTVGSESFLSTEKLGLDEVGKCGFVLVAGGLGERLGYGDIKVSCSMCARCRIIVCDSSSVFVLIPPFVRLDYLPSLLLEQHIFNSTLKQS